MEEKILTICIPTYNRKERLLKQLDSLYAQPDVYQTIIQIIDNHSGYDIETAIKEHFGQEKILKQNLEEIVKIGVTDVYCNNIGIVALASEMGMTVHGGFGLNIFNSYSLDFIERIGVKDTELSFELTAGMINRISGNIKTGVVGYGYLPLMITRNCPNKNGRG